MMNLRENPVSDDHDIDNHQSTSCDVQTYITKANISQMEDDISARIVEKEQGSVRMYNVYSFDLYFKHPDRVSFYTGMPNTDVLKLVEDYLTNDENKCLSKESSFMVCIIKMRMNYLFGDMAYQLNVSASTFQMCFHNVLYLRLEILIKWPTRENLQKSMPLCFLDKELLLYWIALNFSPSDPVVQLIKCTHTQIINIIRL